MVNCNTVATVDTWKNLNTNQHYLSSVIDMGKTYRCKYCGKTFSTISALGGHIAQAHSNKIDIPEKWKEVIRLYTKGLSVTQIAKEVGYSRANVHKILKRLGLQASGTEGLTIKMPNDEALWAYLAGLIDGDGCISVTINKSSRSVPFLKAWIAVINTDKKLMEFLQSAFGGKISAKITTQKNKGGGRVPKGRYKDTYQWRIYGLTNVFFVLKKLLPYLVIKKELARKTIEVLEQYLSIPRSERYKYVEKLVTEVRKVKEMR